MSTAGDGIQPGRRLLDEPHGRQGIEFAVCPARHCLFATLSEYGCHFGNSSAADSHSYFFELPSAPS